MWACGIGKCVRTPVLLFASCWGELNPALDNLAESMQPVPTLPFGLDLTKVPMVMKCLCWVLDHMGTNRCCTAGATHNPLQGLSFFNAVYGHYYFTSTHNSTSKSNNKGSIAILIKKKN